MLFNLAICLLRSDQENTKFHSIFGNNIKNPLTTKPVKIHFENAYLPPPRTPLKQNTSRTLLKTEYLNDEIKFLLG